MPHCPLVLSQWLVVAADKAVVWQGKRYLARVARVVPGGQWPWAPLLLPFVRSFSG